MRQFIRDRLREPSTWAGLGLVITQAAAAYTTRDPQALGALVAAVAAIVIRERAP